MRMNEGRLAAWLPRPLSKVARDEGGTTEGIFHAWWEEGRLMGRNEAVGGHYVLGFRDPPGAALSR